MNLFGSRRAWRWMATGAAAAIVLLVAALRLSEAQNAAPAKPAAPQAVPAEVAKVARRDIGVFARGIGTATAWRSVLVRAEVTGYLAKIAFTEGQHVKTGDLLAEIDPRPYQAALDQAVAKKAADEAQLKNAQLNQARYATLSRQDFVSRQQLTNQQAQVGQLQATIKGDDAAIEAARLNVTYCDLKAPIDGVVGLRLVDIGNLIQAGSAQGIVSITQIHPIAVLFPLPQDDFAAIEAALAAGKPPVLAYSSDGKRQVSSGRLLTPNNQIDTATGTITLKAVFPNRDDKLWPGQFVQARLQLRTDRNAVVIPRSSVQHGPDGLYVFLVKPNQTVARQTVSVGYQDEKNSEILKGLDGGEEIVVAGQSRLQDGTKIAAKPASTS
ncbi:MAG TPA: efflux RND transporter periplasmic adaptor subunit [Stellaceae bacterium]|jgi:multidrug efflux system membrane fusion protein|nr:efflux RND transporter periplasmic adaptor subunit [Stellaceae bacterium]